MSRTVLTVGLCLAAAGCAGGSTSEFERAACDMVAGSASGWVMRCSNSTRDQPSGLAARADDSFAIGVTVPAGPNATGPVVIGETELVPTAWQTLAIVSFAPDGYLEWSTRIRATRSVEGRVMGACPSGDVVVAATGVDLDFGNDVLADGPTALAVFDPDGDARWAVSLARRAEAPAVIGDVACGVDGGLYATVRADPDDWANGVADDDGVLLRAEAGSIRWSVDLPDTDTSAVAIAPDGSVLVAGAMSGTLSLAGSSWHEARSAPLIAAFSSTGDVSWVRRLEHAETSAVSSLAVAPDGALALAIHETTQGDSFPWGWVERLDSTGAALSTVPLDGVIRPRVAFDDEGVLWATAQGGSANLSRLQVMRVGSTAAEAVWQGPDGLATEDVVFAPGGTVMAMDAIADPIVTAGVELAGQGTRDIVVVRAGL